MKRTKRINIRRIAVGVAFAALIVPAGAQAKPTPGSGPILNSDSVATSPDDRAVSRATNVNPYRSWGPRYTAPDDRAFSKATGVGQPESQEQIGVADDSGTYATTAFVLVLLAMSGITLVVWRNRKGGKLWPA